MKDLQKLRRQCAIATLQTLIALTYDEAENTIDEDFYTIPQMVEDAYRYADAMVEYEQQHPLPASSHAQVTYLDSVGTPYQPQSNWEQES